MTELSTITLRILQRTSDKCLTCCSSLQPARHLRLSGNTSRNLSTLRPGRTALPIGFYEAYPGLSVQDVHALIADSKSQSASAS